jgi:ABC-2 type transport system permease protein
MKKLLDRLINYRLRALIRKEFAQTRHDRKLMFSLAFMPLVQLALIGFALSAAVTNVPLAVVDDSRSPESRELIATLTESTSFRLAGYYSSVDQLGNAVSLGNADAGMVVPYDYARDLLRDRQTTIQFLLNATNANTATISRGYAESIIQRFNTGLEGEGIHVHVQPIDGSELARRGQVQLQPAFLYNPGLVGSWFIVTGVLGLLMILGSSLICSAAMVREREAGTLEQLFDSRMEHDRGSGSKDNLAAYHLYHHVDELLLTSESVNEAYGRFVGDGVQLHGWHIAVCPSESTKRRSFIEETSIFGPEPPVF